MTESLRPRLLVVRSGRTLTAREIAPGDDWRVGRHADSPLPLDERSISRAHVRIVCDAAGVRLQDLGSPNGTYLDGKQISGTIILRDGNVVRLGQSTNPEPFLLRFEDPGTRLLEAMSGGAPASPATSSGRVVAREAPPRALAGPPAALPVAAAGPEEATMLMRRPAPAPSEGPNEHPAGPVPQEAVLSERRAGRYALAALGVGAASLMGVIIALRLSQKPWQSVRVDPVKVRAGGRVSLRGPEVEPSDSLKVFVGEAEGTVEEMAAGQIIFTAPRLSGGEAGARPLPLRVERRGIVLLRQTVQYETAPEIAEVVPAEAAVGDPVILKGSGFASDVARVKVKVGPQEATVQGASASEIRFRVPVVTRSVTLDLPLEVRVGDFTAPAPSLRVRPRDAPCFDLAFEGRRLTDLVVEVRSALGPVLLVEAAPSASAAETPEPVARALSVLRQAFAKAQGDPAPRFEVREGSRGPALLVVGLGPAPVEVARFTPPLVAYVRDRAPDAKEAELVPYWSSVVLNELLGVFAKKQPPRLLPSREPLRVALQRLVELNLETGGGGCPSDPEVQTLSPAEREAFEAASLRPPPRFGEVGGTWEGVLENVFVDNGENLELRLEVKQKGTALEGRLLVYEVRGPGIRWSPPAVEGLIGRVLLGGETRIELKVPPQTPYFITRLSAVLGEEGLDGTFVNDGRKTGRFRLVFRPGE